MKKLVALAAIVLSVAIFPTHSHSQPFRLNGGRGLPHLNTAWTLPRGQFTLHAFGSSYYQTVVKKVGNVPQAKTFWDVQSALALYFASGKNLEWAVKQIVYQDTHRGEGYNVPDDLFLNMKFGSFGSKLSPLKVGLILNGRIPLAKEHNILFEPYSGGSVEMGLLGAASYSPDLLIPENAFNLHVNFGFWHHNDTGKLLTGLPNDTLAVLKPSQEFLWGTGFAVPTTQFDFSFELYGRMFLTKPPVTAYSREDAIYFSPSVNYRPKHWAALNVGFDFRLTQDKEETRYDTGLPVINTDLPSYPAWRVNFGATFHLNQAAPPDNRPLFVSANGRLVPRQKSLENQLSVEQRKTENAEEELAKIREERKRMEAMLARLRNLLYDNKTGEASKTEDGKPASENKPAPNKNE